MIALISFAGLICTFKIKMATITLKGEAFNTVGELPKEGDKAPDFQLLNSIKCFIDAMLSQPRPGTFTELQPVLWPCLCGVRGTARATAHRRR